MKMDRKVLKEHGRMETEMDYGLHGTRMGKRRKLRSHAALEAGAYISLTYYSIKISDGEKKFLTTNRTVMKKG